MGKPILLEAKTAKPAKNVSTAAEKNTKKEPKPVNKMN